ncbi:MAG: aldehyde dehydrogenase family protein [Verrucomicrobiota bacterium]|jgi:aldehyde dehydrogenase
MSAVNETLVRDIVSEVLGRLNGFIPARTPGRPAAEKPATALPKAAEKSCGCAARRRRRHFGVFEDGPQACAAAQEAFLQLQEKGFAARERVVEIVKMLADARAVEWGRLELEETRIGRLEHKIEKLRLLRLAPGAEWLRPEARSGDHGITLEEYAPFGVIGAVTPSTHSIPTLSGNAVSMVAAGNAVVFNPHPLAARCAATAVRAYNEAIRQEIGIENLICLCAQPSLETFKAIWSHEAVRLLLVTGGAGAVQAAMETGKRAICAGPGNPPVLVDETCCVARAAQSVIEGAAYDNNLLCIGEKQVFVLDGVADELMAEMGRQGAARLNSNQLEQLTKAAFTFKEGPGGGGARACVNRDLMGKDAWVLAQAAGVEVKAETPLLFAETEEKHPFVQEEQMMPFLPIVRVKSVEEGIAAAKESEHQYRHTSLIHSENVEHVRAMARALDTTIFVKNGPSTAGLGLGGEGYLSYSIATPTGEGVTNPRTFTRARRCVMVEELRIN